MPRNPKVAKFVRKCILFREKFAIRQEREKQVENKEINTHALTKDLQPAFLAIAICNVKEAKFDMIPLLLASTEVFLRASIQLQVLTRLYLIT